ncbi:MAG: molybdenum ABC transporter permease [Chloroflexi bacterium]|nr:MAG: molybdenum ABC transporter permease [Chloroflexota bacterium]RLC95716.1 MAG: molybdenum ABC transporter permease [Chloroflexota bacterium]
MTGIQRWRRLDRLTLVFGLLALLMALFILLPVVKTSTSSSPTTLWDTLRESEVYSSILLTMYAGLLATVVGLLLGVPLAYLLARHDFRGKRLFEGLIDVPIVIPHSAAGIALLFVFGRQFFMGKLLGHAGITFVDTLAGVVIAMMFVSVPFLIDSARDGFKSVDVRLEKVARTLGASPFRVFFHVTLPLAWRSIFSGSVMMWARAVSEFGAVLILAYHVPFLGEHPTVAPILVADRFSCFGLDYARPVAVLVILISLIAFVALRTLALRGQRT